jgi:tight adherence protein B
VNIIFLWAVIFTISVFVIELCFYAVRVIKNPDQTTIRKALKELHTNADAAPDIVKKTTLSDIPFLDHVLSRIPGTLRLNELLRKANVPYTVGFFVSFSGALGLLGFFFASTVGMRHAAFGLIGIVLGLVPLCYVRYKKRGRVEKFKRQLPDALDSLCRALRAGHALASGMRLVADEFDDPIGAEFGETVDEINFGVSLPDALINFAGRIDCSELAYFVVAVALQRESGGNLTEVMENLSRLIRERFKFQEKVRIYSAQARASAFVVCSLPVVCVLALTFLNRPYAETLWIDPAGQVISVIGVCMILVGIAVMRKLVRIDV